MNKKGLIVIIVLIALGIIYQMFLPDIITLIKGEKKHILIDSEYKHQIKNKSRFFKKIRVLKIHNPAGSITILGSAEEIVEAYSIETAFHKNESDAQNLMEKIVPTYNQIDNTLSISVNSMSDYPYNRLRIHHIIKVPNKVTVIIKNRFGNISISNIDGQVQLSNTRGDVTLESISGRIVVKDTSRSKITALQIGDIKVHSVLSNVSLKSIHGSVDLKSEKGTVKIESAIDKTGLIKIEALNSRISLNDVQVKSINIDSSFEDIYIKNITSGILNINQKNGVIALALSRIEFDNIEKIYLNLMDATVVLKYQSPRHPTYYIDLEYGEVLGGPKFVNIENQRHYFKSVFKSAKPEITIKGKYTKIKINSN